jgi:hypothetical protein
MQAPHHVEMEPSESTSSKEAELYANKRIRTKLMLGCAVFGAAYFYLDSIIPAGILKDVFFVVYVGLVFLASTYIFKLCYPQRSLRDCCLVCTSIFFACGGAMSALWIDIAASKGLASAVAGFTGQGNPVFIFPFVYLVSLPFFFIAGFVLFFSLWAFLVKWVAGTEYLAALRDSPFFKTREWVLLTFIFDKVLGAR